LPWRGLLEDLWHILCSYFVLITYGATGYEPAINQALFAPGPLYWASE